jgi:hypothetical protein
MGNTHPEIWMGIVIREKRMHRYLIHSHAQEYLKKYFTLAPIFTYIERSSIYIEKTKP